MGVGIRDQPGLSAQGAGNRPVVPPGPHACGRLGVCAQLITAMHCTAHVPRAYCFSGHFSLSSQRLTPTRLGQSPPRKPQEDWDQGGRGPHLQGPPPTLSLPSEAWRRPPQGLAELPSLSFPAPSLSRPPS
uniref:Uncharacterized protein n=1 Tax=Pipistrellus kuhlii TaxID=59472 RepID=A0A7J7XB43_PIPKU|nr:hypothetical protein mPipKuh1_010621 [Pipistrellus kuhlii]